MNPLATMTADEYRHVIAQLDREGLGYWRGECRHDERRANLRAVEILAAIRRTA